MSSTKEQGKKKLSVLAVDEAELRGHVAEVVRQSVEDTLNGLLDAEADALCQARRYERNAQRASTRSGSYQRELQTTAGTVRLKVPKLRHVPFETAIIERYRRRESSVEEALVEMYLAGVSVRRVEDITEALWGSRVSPSTISDLNQKVFERVDAWRNRPLVSEYPYVFVDGIWLKRSWGGEVQNVSVLVAIGVTTDGYREILGVAEGAREDAESWRQFLRGLRSRGLTTIRLLVSDKSLGLLEALGEFYPEAQWQRCIVHFYRNVLHTVPRGKAKDVARMLKAIHAQEDKEAARQKTAEVVNKLRTMRLEKASRIVEDGCDETLPFYGFPPEHWRHIRTNNPLERLNREIRRRTRVVGSFPDGHAALMLVAARLRYMSGQKWGTERYLNMRLLQE
ncbi:IS256 family transposase [Nitratidesulfovibrio liaohensis]|uniref:IS256 family transposase n=1 Tax=Nitratidesulfovibrio liaohensis TaxID=2604158 RepID=UPI00142111CF|nr:IS256 family transposase [Nitratidesulfovibrio liaohensis]NHZ48028.1 IS256 family transposase [Nitratidesulfovibrio liaohensis]